MERERRLQFTGRWDKNPCTKRSDSEGEGL